MSLQKYNALLKAVELGSISRAAEQMGYTQSAVSRMITDLEEEWGMELLRRSRAGVQVSAAGMRLLPVLRSISSDCAELEYTVGELHGLRTGKVRVGIFTSVATLWIPGLLKSFHQSYPDIEFELLNSENYTEIEEWIRRGKVDCGFVSLPAASDLETIFLKRDMLVAVLPLEHPLAKERVIPKEKLEQEPFIKLKEDVDYEITRFLDQLPHPPRICYEVSNDHTILGMVESGLGISIMHSLMAAGVRYQVAWKCFDQNQYRDIGIATARQTRLSSAARIFVEHVSAWVRETERG